MDFSTILGYLSGLYWIKPDLDTSTLLRTALLVHALDAVLCRVIAGHRGHNKILWTVAGFFLGIWALGTLFFLPARRDTQT
ncbi:MAG: hypothetical protein A3I10_03430 [Deltaproteobacteria bacterium RIFCSPLOWO2_02_FULL_57_26]|nr:MAG: hypothetical protein A3I10_03430 [Deltaproteobacteria bacterium RIFCSPLOWO2_02_FULL_57_26]